MADAAPPAKPEGKSLESLGVSKELQDQAKMMYLVSMFLGFWGPILFGFVIKKPGQDESAWYKWQIRNCWFVFIGGCLCWIPGLYLGWLGFKQIGEGKDPILPFAAPEGFKG